MTIKSFLNPCFLAVIAIPGAPLSVYGQTLNPVLASTNGPFYGGTLARDAGTALAQIAGQSVLTTHYWYVPVQMDPVHCSFDEVTDLTTVTQICTFYDMKWADVSQVSVTAIGSDSHGNTAYAVAFALKNGLAPLEKTLTRGTITIAPPPSVISGPPPTTNIVVIRLASKLNYQAFMTRFRPYLHAARPDLVISGDM